MPSTAYTVEKGLIGLFLTSRSFDLKPILPSVIRHLAMIKLLSDIRGILPDSNVLGFMGQPDISSVRKGRG